jgi:uncharacterized membrane protein YfhO
MCALYLIAFYALGKRATTPIAQKYLKPAFLLLAFAELSAASFIAVKSLPLTERSGYPGRYQEAQRLLSMTRPGPNDFYRIETGLLFTSNDPYLYNYDGISFYSSTINAGINNFLAGLNGFSANNAIIYTASTPLTSALINIRYQIVLGAYPADSDIFWRAAAKLGDAQLLENKYCLPLGFMANGELAGYHHNNNTNQFQSQNDFFRRATGLSGDLVASANITPEDNSTAWFKMPRDGMLYVLYFNPNYPDSQPHALPVGSFPKGATIPLTRQSGTVMGALHFDSALFERGYGILSGQALSLTKFTNTEVCGNVTAHRDGILYTSIPGDKNWSAYVDGVKSEIVLIDGAMISVRMDKGYHEIEFRYFNKSFFAGIIVSLVSLAIFVSLAVIESKRRK